MIVKIENSPLKTKRYRITMDNGKIYDFGLKDGETYIDHKDKIKKLNYQKRHMANGKEKYLIANLIPSPALMSYYLLWTGTNLNDNINHLNKLLKGKKKTT